MSEGLERVLCERVERGAVALRVLILHRRHREGGGESLVVLAPTTDLPTGGCTYATLHGDYCTLSMRASPRQENFSTWTHWSACRRLIRQFCQCHASHISG